MLTQKKSVIQNSKLSLTIIFLVIILSWNIFGFVLNCNPNIEEKQQVYQDIIGYWKEYIVQDSSKNETVLRKIVLNSKGRLEQSIVYELATQCRIWLNDDDISFEDGHLEFWRGEFKGEMSDDKNDHRFNSTKL